jgi:EmrB/QacA subfamily drug resistance transporter
MKKWMLLRCRLSDASDHSGKADMTTRWRSFAVISVAVFISTLDLFIVNIAFPDIRSDFSGASLSELSWVLNAYAIAFAALLLPLGKLGDVLGRKRVFQAGVLLFVAGSALSAVASSVGFLIAARALQGIGAAALTPTSLGLVLPQFPARERATAIGAWAALGAVGAAMGPPLGGLLVQASWRWIFVVNIPLGLLTVLLVQRRFREIREPRALLPDGIGAVLAMGSVGLLTLGLAQGPGWGWDVRVLASFAAALGLGLALVLRSLRHRSPLLNLALFRSPAFSLASASTLLFFAGFAAFLLGGVLYLTQVWHYSALQAGFGFAPGPAMAAIFAAISGRLADRFGPAVIGVPGGALFALGTLLFTGLGAQPDYVGEYLPGMLIGGAGVGMILPSFTASAVMAVPAERLAAGIAAETMFRQIGAALGVATFVAVFGTPVGPEVLDSFDRSFTFMTASSLAAGLVLLALTIVLRRNARGSAISLEAARSTDGVQLAPTTPTASGGTR